MKLCEILEAKKGGTITVPVAKPRNPMGINPKTTGAGSHTPKKYKRPEKHKKPPETA
jgi:hypothetical protein